MPTGCPVSPRTSIGENVACLRGSGPPTFGSGSPFLTPPNIWGKADFQGKLACFPLSAFSQSYAGLRIFCNTAVQSMSPREVQRTEEILTTF